LQQQQQHQGQQQQQQHQGQQQHQHQLVRHHELAVQLRQAAAEPLSQLLGKAGAAALEALADAAAAEDGAEGQAGGTPGPGQLDAAAPNLSSRFGAFLEALCAAGVAMFDLLLLGDEDLILQVPVIVPYGGRTAAALVRYVERGLKSAEAAVRRGDWAGSCKVLRDLEGKLRHRHVPVVLGTEWGPPPGFTQPGW
jgi:hypothetical protein